MTSIGEVPSIGLSGAVTVAQLVSTFEVPQQNVTVVVWFPPATVPLILALVELTFDAATVVAVGAPVAIICTATQAPFTVVLTPLAFR